MKENKIADEILVERVQCGDDTAMDSLIGRYQAAAYRFVYRLARDQDLTADVVAEGFYRVYRSIGCFRGESSFTTWMYRIMTNCFLDARKKTRWKGLVSLQSPVFCDDDLVEREPVSTHPTAQESMERRERAQDLSRAVSELPDNYQVMIVMFYLQMLSYEEISDVLTMPLGTVKSRMNRARGQLRQRLDGELWSDFAGFSAA